MKKINIEQNLDSLWSGQSGFNYLTVYSSVSVLFLLLSVFLFRLSIKFAVLVHGRLEVLPTSGIIVYPAAKETQKLVTF